MKSCASNRLQRATPESTLAKLLVCLPESRHAERQVNFVVALAHRHGAEVRGLTLVDTSNFDRLVTTCETASAAVLELRRLQAGVCRRNKVRAYFAQACLAAGLSFDVRVLQGQPCEVVPRESQTHDLTIMTAPLRRSLRRGNDLSITEIVDLILRGVGPVLALRGRTSAPQRILLVHDGSAASGRAIDSFVNHSLFADTQTRLLAVSSSESAASAILENNAERLRCYLPELETGYLVGRGSQLVPAYIRQWQSDLVVLGAQPSPPLMRYLFGETARAVLQKTQSALYATY